MIFVVEYAGHLQLMTSKPKTTAWRSAIAVTSLNKVTLNVSIRHVVVNTLRES